MKVISLLPLFSAATLAHPSGLWWGTDQCYSIPANTDNYCLEGQKAGFDWSDLANGDNWSPEGFNFIGFSPKSNCQAAGTGNCIGGKLSRNDNWTLRVDAEAAPFSVRDFHLATSRTTDVLITYSLADGSFCHQVATSSPEGLDIHNDQCGGATSVEFRLPEESAFGECDMDIHRIHFDCSTGPKPPPTPSTFSLGYPKPSTTTVVEVHTFTFTKTPVLTTSTVWTTAEVTITECPPAVTDCPPHSTVILTSTYSLSTTVCSATVTAPGPDHTIPPVNVQSSTVTRTITVMPNTVETPPAVSLSSCPDVVPKCMNTWLTIPKCDSNSDTGCFCPSTMFTEKVTSCIKAWGSSQEEIRSGLSYFAGICAPYVPSNPTIIDHVPPPPPVDIPCTTITWSSETVTVPVVSFSTITIHSTTTVSLIPGSSTTGTVGHGQTSSMTSSDCTTSITLSTSSITPSTTCTSSTTSITPSTTPITPSTTPITPSTTCTSSTTPITPSTTPITPSTTCTSSTTPITPSTSPITPSTTCTSSTTPITPSTTPITPSTTCTSSMPHITPSMTTTTTCTSKPTAAVATGSGGSVITSNDGSRTISCSIWVLGVTFLLLFLH